MPGPDEYWNEGSDFYTDPDTKTLKNIPGLRTQDELDAYEEIIFQAHFPEAMAYAHACRRFDLKAWQAIHRLCFADVYTWAGDIRTVRIRREQTVFAFCSREFCIGQDMKRITPASIRRR